MQLEVIARTSVDFGAMHRQSGGKWEARVEDGMAGSLAEFAGRQCYESWDRPNPATATNEGYLKNIIDHRHFSVLEHGSVSFRLSGCSRSCTHELVRHRHVSPSQLSQRYVEVGADAFVVPPLYAHDDVSQELLSYQWDSAIKAYDALVARWLPKLLQRGITPHRARKMAREAARAVLPNMTPTALVLTANHRTWREFLEKRGSIDADQEIRQVAIEAFLKLSVLEPALYQDFSVGNDKETGLAVLVCG